ncbi:MAG: PAS domain S-box protein [Candidatus Velthaea sp.]
MDSDLSRVVDALPDLVFRALPDGQIDFFNQRWCEYTGLRVDEACGRGWLTAIHPQDVPELRERWRSMLTSAVPHEFEARLRRADGAYRRFHFRAAPVTDAAGSLVKWCGTCTDIEDRKQAEEALRAREHHYRSIVDSIPAQISTMTPSGAVESANRLTLEFFGATLDEIKSWATADLVHPDDLPAVVAAWTRSVQSEEAYEIEHRMRRADGVYRWFHVRGLPLRDSEGQVVRWHVLETDVDDRKRAEALLAGEKRFLEMAAGGLSMRAILEALCEFVESTDGGCYCSVVLTDPSGTRLEYGAAPSLPASFLTSIVGRPVSVDAGPSAMAACLNEQVIAADLSSETRWAAYDWCPMALAHGLQACWSTPIASSTGKILGAFAIYYNVPKTPTLEQKALIDQFKHIASIAIERAQNDAALKHSEARKAAILDSALDCIMTIDHEGRLTEFNPAAERTFGYRRDEVIGKALADVIVPPSLREKHRLGFVRYLATGEERVIGRRIEIMALRADGVEFPVELAITRIPLDGPPSFTGYLRDITERKQSEETFRAIVETTPECVKLVARDGTLLRVNSAGLAMAGADPTDHVVGRSFYDFLAPEDRSRYREFNERICSGEKGFLQFDIIGMRGDRRQMETHAAPLRINDGSVVQLGVTRDITERKRSEEKLRRSEAYLAEAQKLSLTGSFGWRVSTDEHVWSDQTFRIFEYEVTTEITLERILERVHPADKPLMQQAAALAAEGRDFDYECRLLMPSGSVKYLHIVAHASRDQDGRVEYIGAVQDITERRLSEETLGKVRSELAHVARVTSLGALTASIAHEVNQPLSGIITNAGTCLRMLAADPPNVDGARETAQRTIRDGHRASDVIKRLRALFSKKDAATELVDVNEATREVLALSWSELHRSGATLRTELAADLPAVTGDRVQLQQVILNLLLNASEAMSSIDDRPRDLLVRTQREEPERVRLSVQDSGVGLGQTEGKLFEAFFTTKSGGMGIGLSISRSIIESHRGRLWASPNDGPGATVSFSIPVGVESFTDASAPGAIRTVLLRDGQSL